MIAVENLTAYPGENLEGKIGAWLFVLNPLTDPSDAAREFCAVGGPSDAGALFAEQPNIDVRERPDPRDHSLRSRAARSVSVDADAVGERDTDIRFERATTHSEPFVPLR